MATVIDDTTASLMQAQNAQNSASASQGMAFIMEQGRMQFQAAVGMREAAAVQEMRTSAQSREVLQTQAALNAPRQTAPSYVPEAVAGPATATK